MFQSFVLGFTSIRNKSLVTHVISEWKYNPLSKLQQVCNNCSILSYCGYTKFAFGITQI